MDWRRNFHVVGTSFGLRWSAVWFTWNVAWASCLGEQRSLVEGYYYQRTGIETLAGESKRTVEATYKMLQRVRQALQRCVENAAQQEEATA